MQERLTALVGARITEFQRKMKEVRNTIRRLPNNVRINIRVFHKKAQKRVEEFRKRMNRIATVMRSIAEISMSTLGGALITFIPMLSPLIASLTGGVLGLASAFSAAGAGVGAFVAVAIPALNDVFEANKEIVKLREELAKTDDLEKRKEILEEIKQVQAGLTKEQQRGLKAVQDFSKFWGEFAAQFQKPVIDIFSRSLKQLENVLKDLEPMFKSVLDAANNMSKNFGKFLKSPDVQRFFDFLNRNAAPAMEKFGEIASNLTRGLMNLLVAFEPLGNEMLDGLVDMTQRFAEWSSTLSESKGFQTFVDYIRENGPKVLDLIGNITMFLIEIGKGMAPLGSALLDLANSFFSWATSMMQSHPWIGRIFAGFISLIGVITTFLPWVLLAKTMFSGFLSTAVSWIVRAGSFLLRFATGPVGLVVQAVIALATIIISNWDAISAWTSTIWNAITNYLSDVWKGIQVIFDKALRWIADKTGTDFETLKSRIDSAINQAKSIIERVWAYIKNTFKNALDFLKALVKGDFEGMKNAIKNQMRNTRENLISIWSNIRAKVREAVRNILDAVRDRFEQLKQSVRDKMEQVRTNVRNAWDRVKNFLRGINLRSIGRNIIQGLIDGIGSMANRLVNKAKKVVNDAINAAKNLLGIRSPSRVFMEIGEFTGEGFAIGIERMRNTVSDAIRGITTSAAQAIGAPEYATHSASTATGGAMAATVPTRPVVIEVPININDREFARATAQAMLEEQNRLERQARRARGD